ALALEALDRDPVVPGVGRLGADAQGDRRPVGRHRRVAGHAGHASRLGQQGRRADHHLARDAAPVPALPADQARLDADHDEARLGPVVLVPGYGGGQGALSRLADRIRATGRTATVLTLPGDGTGDLNAQAEALRAAVGGARNVDIVGYSAGGVVVRLWVARHGGEHVARRVVTLGSPLHGAQLAAVGAASVPGACPVACQQLVPGSSLLRDLDRTPLPPRLPWLSVWTEDDETVTPPDSARLTGA